MEFGVGAVLLMMFIIIFPIMLINMLVALLSDIFDRVQENMEEEWRRASLTTHTVNKDT